MLAMRLLLPLQMCSLNRREARSVLEKSLRKAQRTRERQRMATQSALRRGFAPRLNKEQNARRVAFDKVMDLYL